MRALVGLVVGVSLAAVSLACGDASPRVRVATRDSAGTVIVESASPVWGDGPGWSIDTTPILDLATIIRDSAHDFDDVEGALRLKDGSIAVADYRSGQIRFYSAEGGLLGTTGRRGDGPGEFRALSGLERYRGDSLVAFDASLGRVTVLGDDHETGRMFRLPNPSLDGLRVLAGSAFVALVFSTDDMPAGGTGTYRMPATLVRFSANGVRADTLAKIPGPEGFRMEHGDRWLDVRPLFPKYPQVATFRDRVFHGSAERMEIELLQPGGTQPRRSIRVDGIDLGVSHQQADAERAAMIHGNSNPLTKQVMAALPDPGTRPAYSDLLVDSLGYLWAEEYTPIAHSGERTRWNVFSPDGEWLGAVEVPFRFLAYDIAADWILGDRFDSLDVEHPELLRLHRER